MRTLLTRIFGRPANVAGAASLLAMVTMAGCPGSNVIDTTTGDQNGNQTDGNQSTNSSNNQTNPAGKHVVSTGIEIQKDGLVSVGDGIIAFGSSVGGSEVSYVRVGESAATLIPGRFAGSAVYCAGKKVILVEDKDVRGVSVFDTTTGVRTAVPGTDVWDINSGSYLENSYIAVDGNLVGILNRGATAMQLVAIDVSGATPVMTTFDTELVNGDNVAVDGAAGQIAVMEDNEFVSIFKVADGASATPNRIDVKTSVGVSIAYYPNIRLAGGNVLFASFSDNDVYLLSAAGGTATRLAENPAQNDGLSTLALAGGFFAYYLNRSAADFDASAGARVAIGAVAAPSTIFAGSGSDLGKGIPSGFGHSVAIAPDGSVTYIAGRFAQSLGAGVNEPTFLQANFGGGFGLLTDENGDAVLASDVVCTSSLLAFKIAGEGNLGATLGYYQP